MKKIYFIHQDPGYFQRRSDGLELLIAPEINGEKICFYCDEYNSISLSIDDFANNKFVSKKKLTNLRGATLKEVCDQGYAKNIDLVKCHDIISGELNLILAKQNSSQEKQSFFTFESESKLNGLLCKIQNFHDEKIYFYSPKRNLFWNSIKDFSISGKFLQNKNFDIYPISLSNILEANLIEFITGIGEYSTSKDGLKEINGIEF